MVIKLPQCLFNVLNQQYIFHIFLQQGSESHSTAVTIHESESLDDVDNGDGLVETEGQEDLEIFEPTNEWQTIKEGSRIKCTLLDYNFDSLCTILLPQHFFFYYLFLQVHQHISFSLLFDLCQSAKKAHKI